jgi:hypothetical protein
MSEHSILKLIEKITAAFAELPFPGNDNLVGPSYGEETMLVKEHFSNHSSRENLTPAFIDFDGALSFFSNEAFRYYISAFMIADIHEKLDFNNPVIRLCWPVTPQSENQKIAEVHGGGTIGERAKVCFELFTEEQVQAIVAYLNWKLEKDEDDLLIKQALENYWLKRAGKRI